MHLHERETYALYRYAFADDVFVMSSSFELSSMPTLSFGHATKGDNAVLPVPDAQAPSNTDGQHNMWRQVPVLQGFIAQGCSSCIPSSCNGSESVRLRSSFRVPSNTLTNPTNQKPGHPPRNPVPKHIHTVCTHRPGIANPRYSR